MHITFVLSVTFGSAELQIACKTRFVMHISSVHTVLAACVHVVDMYPLVLTYNSFICSASLQMVLYSTAPRCGLVSSHDNVFVR